jgi:Na+-transporting NADH:ubiquinone oxidoreductase subunit C
VQRSNTYILIYTIILTVVCGVVLSLTAMGLKPLQDKNKVVEKKINILNTVMSIEGMTTDQALAVYDQRIASVVVDFKGNVLADQKAGEVNVQKEYKKPLEERIFPVYMAKSETDPNKIEYYIFPVYGFGLWNNIWGYVSLKEDLNTINGINFGHASETPGLGARIASDPAVTQRYVGKQLFDDKGDLLSVVMQKGEGNNYDSDAHKVDGMSGATLTGKGVNNMLKDYFTAYQNYFKSISHSQTTQN